MDKHEERARKVAEEIFYDISNHTSSLSDVTDMIAQALRDVERETVERFRKAEREDGEYERGVSNKPKPCPVCGGSIEHMWNCTLNR